MVHKYGGFSLQIEIKQLLTNKQSNIKHPQLSITHSSTNLLNYFKPSNIKLSYHYKMQFITLTLLAALASASPIRRAVGTTASNTNVWPVSGFNVGCSPAACEYNFVVTRAAGPSNPGFNTTCTGNDLDTEYASCADKSVAAKMIARQYPIWEIDVKHSFEGGDKKAAVNDFARGNGTTENDKATFTVTVYKTTE